MGLGSIVTRCHEEGLAECSRHIRLRLLRRAYFTLLERYPRVAPDVIRAFVRVHPRYVSSPFDIFYVDPEHISRVNNPGPSGLYGVVMGGNWDKNTTPLDTLITGDLRDYLVEGDPDPLYETFTDVVTGSPEGAWGHNSTETFEERLSEIDQLYNSMRTDGYLTQNELRERGSAAVAQKNNERPCLDA